MVVPIGTLLLLHVKRFKGITMTINRIECIKKSNIFETDEAQKIINANKVGVTVDLYAGANNIADITNDYDKSFQTKYHMEAIQFLKTLGDNSVILSYAIHQQMHQMENIGKTS